MHFSEMSEQSCVKFFKPCKTAFASCQQNNRRVAYQAKALLTNSYPQPYCGYSDPPETKTIWVISVCITCCELLRLMSKQSLSLLKNPSLCYSVYGTILSHSMELFTVV